MLSSRYREACHSIYTREYVETRQMASQPVSRYESLQIYYNRRKKKGSYGKQAWKVGGSGNWGGFGNVRPAFRVLDRYWTFTNTACGKPGNISWESGYVFDSHLHSTGETLCRGVSAMEKNGCLAFWERIPIRRWRVIGFPFCPSMKDHERKTWKYCLRCSSFG